MLYIIGQPRKDLEGQNILEIADRMDVLLDVFFQTIKVGVSNSPEERLKSLQTGNPSSLFLLYKTSLTDAYSVEQKIHRKLKESNEYYEALRGEWFKQKRGMQHYERRHVYWINKLTGLSLPYHTRYEMFTQHSC